MTALNCAGRGPKQCDEIAPFQLSDLHALPPHPLIAFSWGIITMTNAGDAARSARPSAFGPDQFNGATSASLCSAARLRSTMRLDPATAIAVSLSSWLSMRETVSSVRPR